MSKVIVGVFPIYLINLNNTEECLKSLGFPYGKINDIIQELHRSSTEEKYLLFVSKSGTVFTTHDYPESRDKSIYVNVSIKSWQDFQAKAALLGSE